jgi:hypothetical protein
MDLPWLAQVVEVSWKKEVCTMKLPGCPAVDCRNHFSKLVPGLDVGPSAWLDSSRTRGIAETLTENRENGSNCSNHASAPSGQLRQSGYDGDVGANPGCYSVDALHIARHGNRPECLLYQTASVGTLRGLRRMETICGTAM